MGRFRHQVDVAGEFGRLAREDEAAAGLLAHSGAYRQAVYFLVQAMEKQVRAKIFSLVNPKLPYFRERNRTHSLEDAVAFLIEIVSHSETVRRQVKDQLHAQVLGEVRYHHLHNNVRYPVYFDKYDAYSVLDALDERRLKLDNQEQSLKPITEVGGGVAREPETAPLSELIQKLNQLFEGELSDADLLGYAHHIKGKLLENEKLAQQAARNSKEQFALRDFQHVLMDNVIEGIDRYQAMAGQVMGNPNVQKAFGEIMLDLVYQEFQRQKVSAETSKEIG